MRTAYLTDQFSTLGNLAAVAYRDPEFFREVKNQVYLQSPTQYMDDQRPSDVFEALVANKSVISAKVLQTLEGEYALDGEFADYIDINIGPDWRNKLTREFYPVLQSRLDSTSEYLTSLPKYVLESLNVVFPQLPNINIVSDKISQDLDKIPESSTGAALAAVMAGNNPQTKLSTPPPNSKIALENTVPLGFDYRGVPFTTGYSTLEDYWSNIPYPGMTSPSIIPSTMRESITGGLVGYLSGNPLESLFNPVGASSVLNSGIQDGNSLNFSGAFGTGFVAGQLPFFDQTDQNASSISLIGEEINGYTSFDLNSVFGVPPLFGERNPDPDGGTNPLSRNFNTAFTPS